MTNELCGCIIPIEDTYIILTDDDGSIMAGEQQMMLDYWTKGWEKGLTRGGTWSTGACLSFIQFRPRIFKIENVEWLKNNIAGDRGGYEILTASGAAGFVSGLECLGPDVKTVYDEGQEPEFFRD